MRVLEGRSCLGLGLRDSWARTRASGIFIPSRGLVKLISAAAFVLTVSTEHPSSRWYHSRAQSRMTLISLPRLNLNGRLADRQRLRRRYPGGTDCSSPSYSVSPYRRGGQPLISPRDKASQAPFSLKEPAIGKSRTPCTWASGRYVARSKLLPRISGI